MTEFGFDNLIVYTTASKSWLNYLASSLTGKACFKMTLIPVKV